MKAWEDWAMIDEAGTVQAVNCFNVGGYTMAQWIAHEQYGPNAYAVDVTQTLAHVGDHYRNGQFFHVDPFTGEETGEIAVVLPTAEEVAQANSDAIDDILVSLLEF